MYNWDFYTVMQLFDLFTIGVWVTFLYTAGLYTAGSIAIGIVVGLAACFARLSRFWWLCLLSRSYQELFRCTQLLVHILWAYHALPMILGISISNTTAGLLTPSLYIGSFYAEIFRSGILAIDTVQHEACCGQPHVGSKRCATS